LGTGRAKDTRLGNLGMTYFALGDVRRAIEYCQQQLKMAK
jgi:hypothetical protein